MDAARHVVTGAPRRPRSFGRVLADLMAGRQHISNQYEFVGSSWDGVMFGLENKDLMV